MISAAAAATGTARNAPITPNVDAPRVTASRTITACRFIDFDCSQGCSTLPSSCCTATMMPSTMSASTGPLDTSAINTDRPPATNAPTIGTKPPMNVMMARA